MKPNSLMRPAAAFCAAVTGSLLLSTSVWAEPEWVTRSNENSDLVLKIWAKYGPEGAGSIGVDGLDEKITDLKPKVYERSLEDTRAVLKKLEAKLDKETDPKVLQDLEILVKASKDSIRSSELERKMLLPYENPAQTIFRGIRGLLDPQVPAERYPAALVRLKRYAGMERGYDPITELAIDRTQERLKIDGLIGPFRGEVEQDIERSMTIIAGLKPLFEKAELEGWEEPYAKLEEQMGKYNDWVREVILPRARDDFRLPPALYEDALQNWGVDASPEALIQAATQGYMDIRNEMQALAPLIAKQKGYETTDYREVIRLLKEERIPGDELLDYYYNILGELEAVIRNEKLVTLPERNAGIRMATAAETAVQPAAHLEIPRLIGNTGEYPEFILPLLAKNDDGTWARSDDSYEAGTWTLTAHEARPGHELQFSSMLESGVSTARAIFAFNSANVEGWALYAEAITKPFMPLEAQLISLQYRLARAARMFLDPMLNLGLITPENAKRILTDDVVLGEGWAQNEIERYTYRMPGQATAYYYGYMNLQALRTQTELALAEQFDQMAFHDFILSQGLLPPDLLKKAVMEEFVPRYKAPGLASQ